MSNSYRTLIERLRQFADGHYIIQKFYHGQIDAADLDKEPRYPMMHVLPVDIRASEGTLDYALEIRFADIGRDKEIKTDYQKEIISDMSRLALSLISEIENGQVLFGEDAEIVDKQATIIPFIEEFTHVLTGVQLNVTIRLPFNWSACDIPADYSPNITDNPETGSGILTKIGIYNDGEFVGYTSFVDFSDDFNVTVNGNKIEVTLVGGGGGAVDSVNGQTGVVVLDANDVGADASGTAASAISTHVGLADPHTQYALESSLGAVATSNDYNDLDNLPNLSGYGDMFKSTYDTDNDGIVDKSETVQIIVRNSTGSTLTKGQVVYLSGATGNRPNAVLAQANTEATSSKTIGIVVADIANNADGNVAVSGTLHDLVTNSFADGDAVWLSATTAGAFTATPPSEPNHTVFIGYIARSHPTAGRLVIAIQNGYELDELHGVLITSPSTNDVLYYASDGLWKNKALTKSDVGLGNVDNTSDANKPVSTAQQTALNLKLNKADIWRTVITTDSAVGTGSSGVIKLASIEVPANTFGSGWNLLVRSRIRRTSGSLAWSNHVYVNTSDSLSGATLAGIANSTTGILVNQSKRDWAIKGATTEVIRALTSVQTDDFASSVAFDNLSIDWTQKQYIIFAVNSGGVAEQFVHSFGLVEGRKTIS